MVLPMPKHNQHVISQQVLQLDVPSSPDTHKILQAVSQRLRAHIMLDIEALFDRFAGSEQTLRLERVEIDLGNLDGIDWQQQFESRLITQLTDVLEEVISIDADESSAKQPGEDQFEQLIYFLDHGRLPSGAKPPAENWSHQWLRQLDSTQWHSLRATLSRFGHARQRLIHTLDDTTLVIAVEKLLGLREVQQVFNCCFPSELSRDKRLLWRMQFWLSLLDPFTSFDVNNPGITIMRRLLQLHDGLIMPTVSKGEASAMLAELPEPWCDWLAKIKDNLDSFSNMTSLENSKPVQIKDNTSRQSTPDGLAETAKEPPGTGVPRLVPDTPRAVADGINEASKVQSNSTFQASSHVSEASTENTQAETGEVVTVNGAGCIIMHPFLEELFRSSKLLDGRGFRSEASRQRAVHLLSYLTFGDPAPAEYELLLPKLLCGMAWQEPLAAIELGDEECLACDQLQDAVIRHWQALKACSANWVREQFLLRPARLEQTDDAWRLTVERRAQDVLLDRLPWGLGVISLPWRHGLIYVRWME